MDSLEYLNRLQDARDELGSEFVKTHFPLVLGGMLLEYQRGLAFDSLDQSTIIRPGDLPSDLGEQELGA